MSPDDRRAIAEALTAAMAIYRHNITPQEIRLWIAALADFDARDIVRALGAHLRDPDVGQYQPKPADVVRNLRGGSAANAAWAWAEVQRAARSVGGYATVVFSDPGIHSAIEALGGWVWLCEQPERELPFIAKRFEALYTSARQHAGSHPRALIGRTEAENRSNGHPHRGTPVLIGDRATCLVVHQTGREGGPTEIGHAPALLANLNPKELTHVRAVPPRATP